MVLSMTPMQGHSAVDLIKDPFFLMMPDVVLRATGRLPRDGLATIIASQAVISGAFSLTQQAIQLGFMPRMRIKHTSASGRRADLHPGDQLGADDHGDHPRALLPAFVKQPRRGLWHRGDGGDVHRYLPAQRRAAHPVEMAGVEGAP
jgi:hypothetical protein